MNWSELIGALIGSIIGAGAVALITGISTEFGKRWATRLDLQNLLNEVQKVTATTEQIKAEIEGGLWIQQRIWERKWLMYEEILGYTARLIKSVSFYSAVWNNGSLEIERKQRAEIELCTQALILKAPSVWLLSNYAFIDSFQKFADKIRFLPLFEPGKDPKRLDVTFIESFLDEAIASAKSDLRVLPEKGISLVTPTAS